MKTSKVLNLLACIVFALAIFGVTLPDRLSYLPLGLLFLAASFLVE